jgi:ribosomal protein L37AE/L43A
MKLIPNRMYDKHPVVEEPDAGKSARPVLKTSQDGDILAEFNQQRVSRKVKGSNNWLGMVFTEDLNLKAMSRGMLSKHTLDARWGQFLSILEWVCWKRGIYFAKVDASGTSQTCPQCLTVTGKKELSQRVHQCSECGYKTDRDVAAAQVVMQRGLAAVGSTVKMLSEGKVVGLPAN